MKLLVIPLLFLIGLLISMIIKTIIDAKEIEDPDMELDKWPEEMKN